MSGDVDGRSLTFRDFDGGRAACIHGVILSVNYGNLTWKVAPVKWMMRNSL